MGYEWEAPSGVTVRSNIGPPPNRLIDRSVFFHRWWSAKFVANKIVNSFRKRRTDGFWWQRAGFISLHKAEQDWTVLVRTQTGVEDAVVVYDGLKWCLRGSVDGVQFTGGTIGLSKRAGRIHKEWKALWPEEERSKVPPALTPVEAVVDALYREHGLIREEA